MCAGAFNTTLTKPRVHLDCLVRHGLEGRVGHVPAQGRVPGVVAVLPGHLAVQVDERDEHVVDGVHDDHVVVDAHQAADRYHAATHAWNMDGVIVLLVTAQDSMAGETLTTL